MQSGQLTCSMASVLSSKCVLGTLEDFPLSHKDTREALGCRWLGMYLAKCLQCVLPSARIYLNIRLNPPPDRVQGSPLLSRCVDTWRLVVVMEYWGIMIVLCLQLWISSSGFIYERPGCWEKQDEVRVVGTLTPVMFFHLRRNKLLTVICNILWWIFIELQDWDFITNSSLLLTMVTNI